mmetsp:Transcript_96410/g.261863  ORF Transcript_96410/g.261863 Transcript_96410/m.261863 type:complete len:288 (-) Transcript_96410:355-1218(-)
MRLSSWSSPPQPPACTAACTLRASSAGALPAGGSWERASAAAALAPPTAEPRRLTLRATSGTAGGGCWASAWLPASIICRGGGCRYGAVCPGYNLCTSTQVSSPSSIVSEYRPICAAAMCTTLLCTGVRLLAKACICPRFSGCSLALTSSRKLVMLPTAICLQSSLPVSTATSPRSSAMAKTIFRCCSERAGWKAISAPSVSAIRSLRTPFPKSSRLNTSRAPCDGRTQRSRESATAWTMWRWQGENASVYSRLPPSSMAANSVRILSANPLVLATTALFSSPWPRS